MPINTETLNKKLYKLLSKYSPKPLDSSGKVTPIEDEADVFKFTFTKDGEEYGEVFATIDNTHTLALYYDDDVTESPSDPTPGAGYDDSWYGLLKYLKNWAQRNQLSWKLDNKDHLAGDMARREHMKKKENIAEGYYPMGKSASYNDSVPSVKIILQHTRQIQEGEQRFRNIARIFLENQVGERILAPTNRPGIAKVYARHLAEGGMPHDERWKHIGGLVEEYSKMAGFVRATRGGQFNESAQKLVETGINHYSSLRESLSRMTGHRGYNAYFESWTPSLMEDETDTTSINELFVQETLDPRIESVMPILSKLHKQVSEMTEVTELAEWAESLVEGPGPAVTAQQNSDSPAMRGSPALAHYAAQLDALHSGIEEGDGGQEALNPVGIPEGAMDEGHAELQDIVDNEDYDALYDLFTANTPAGKFVQDLYNDVVIDTGLHPDDDFESIQEIVFDRLVDEFGQGIDEGLDSNQKRVGQLGPTEKVKNNNIGKLVGANENFINTDDQAVVTEDDLEEDLVQEGQEDLDAILRILRK
jgi:hypothetical protein